SVRLFNPPAAVVDGGALLFDQSYVLDAPAAFGLTPLSVSQITPSSAVGKSTSQHFVLRGANLDRATAVRLNDLTVASSTFAPSPDGRSLGFDVVVSAPGFYTVAVDSAGAPTRYLPAALLVSNLLAVDTVTTNYPNDPTKLKLSSGGGTTASVKGSGFDSSLELYFFEAAAGFTPAPANRQSYTLGAGPLASTDLAFSSPACIAGRSYQIVIKN